MSRWVAEWETTSIVAVSAVTSSVWVLRPASLWALPGLFAICSSRILFAQLPLIFKYLAKYSSPLTQYVVSVRLINLLQFKCCAAINKNAQNTHLSRKLDCPGTFLSPIRPNLALDYFGKSLRRLVLPLILCLACACCFSEMAAFPVTNTSQSTKLVGCLVGWLVGCLTSLHFASLAYNATALSQRHFESSRGEARPARGVVDGAGILSGAVCVSPCLADDLSALWCTFFVADAAAARAAPDNLIKLYASLRALARGERYQVVGRGGGGGSARARGWEAEPGSGWA